MQSTITLSKMLASALLAGALASSACNAQVAPVVAPDSGAPVQLAATSPAAAARGAPVTAAFPAHEAGVRAAAANGPDELRWYIQRTRMIHNFYYPKYAPAE